MHSAQQHSVDNRLGGRAMAFAAASSVAQVGKLKGDRSMQILVTGATGFVGSNLVRHLLDAGHGVRALVRPGSDRRALAGLDVALVEGSLADQDSIRCAAEGCELAFHVAALYAIDAAWDPYYAANVIGTRNLLAACRDAGVRRVVHTSSAIAVGSAPPGGAATEDAIWDLGELAVPYATTKYQAEVEVLRAVAVGQDVVIVNPSAPIGEWDWKPTATGDTLLRFLRGRLPALPRCRGNYVDVADVVRGHWLAAERGRCGERYLLTGANLDEKGLGRCMADAADRPPPARSIPPALLVVAAGGAEAAFRLLGRSSPISKGMAGLLRKRMFFDCGKAVRELGYAPSPIDGAFHRAATWYRDHGYLRS
jgi:dihydroflavonol-4-reductase